MPDPVCRTCKFASWQYTENGNVRRKFVGRCTYEIGEPPVLPAAVDLSWPPKKQGVWWDHEYLCPTWEAKD